MNRRNKFKHRHHKNKHLLAKQHYAPENKHKIREESKKVKSFSKFKFDFAGLVQNSKKLVSFLTKHKFILIFILTLISLPFIFFRMIMIPIAIFYILKYLLKPHKVFRWFVSIMVFLAMFYGQYSSDTDTQLGVIALLVIGILFFFINGLKTRCPSCKHLFAMKHERTDVVDRRSEPRVEIIKRTKYDASGNFIGHEEEPREFTKTITTMRTDTSCKYCGHRESNHFERIS